MSRPTGNFLRASILVLLGLGGCATPPAERSSSPSLNPAPRANGGEAERAESAIKRAQQLCLQNRHAEAEAEVRQVVARDKHNLGPENRAVLAGQSVAAVELLHQTRYAEAEEQLRTVLQIQQRTLGAAHADSLNTQRSLALALRLHRKNAEAEVQYRAILKILEPIRGAEHPDILIAHWNIAKTLLGQSKHADAEREYRAVSEPMQRVLGTDHRDTLFMLNEFAWCLGKLNKMEEARELSWRAVTGARRRWGLAHTNTKRFEQIQKQLSQNKMLPVAGPEVEEAK